VTEHNIELLLQSFITGEFRMVPHPLLQLMDTWRVVGGDLKVKWIPYHMMEVLRQCATCGNLDDRTSDVLQSIEELFSYFKGAKVSSGDGWEALFVMALLVRSKAKLFKTSLLPLRKDLLSDAHVSFNKPFLGNADFGEIKQFDKFIESLILPSTFPHIAIYMPTHAQFERYDVIVAVYYSIYDRKLYGYQLKEGNKNGTAVASSLFTKSFVIRGEALKNSHDYQGWHVASTDEINEFFGESGSNWTPIKWKALSAAE
jgi:hypothetical protein